jgi:5-formyltetrahydrofolate cyclo-ligase
VTTPTGSTEIADAKRAIRREMRSLRKSLPDRGERSARIWAQVRELPEVAAAQEILVFVSVPGEPETEPFIGWCRGLGKVVHFPEDEPAPDPGSIDVVIVPGTAFTPAGDRLGQGGGWYDRFLAAVRPDCLNVGVAFAPQVVESLPVEPHDLKVDVVVTDESVARAPRTC